MNDDFITLYKNLMTKVRDEKYEKVKKERVYYPKPEIPNKDFNTEQQLFILKYFGFLDSLHYKNLPSNKKVSFLALLLGKTDNYIRVALKNIENTAQSQSKYNNTFRHLEKLKLVFDYYELSEVAGMIDEDMKRIKQ